jgi:hypothetical protein
MHATESIILPKWKRIALRTKASNSSKTKATDIGLVICGLRGLSGGSPRLIMNHLGKKDGRIFGIQYAT